MGAVNDASIIAGAAIALLVLVWVIGKWLVGAIAGHFLVQTFIAWRRNRRRAKDMQDQNERGIE